MPLTATSASVGILTAFSAEGMAVLGLFDEKAAPVLDEAGNFILNEDGT